MKRIIKKTNNEQEFFKNYLDTIPKYVKNYIRLSSDISSYINEILGRNGLNQKFLAEELNKKESEISKWLSGNHNFTIKTIAKIEDILQARILLVPFELKSYCFKTDTTNTYYVTYNKQNNNAVESLLKQNQTSKSKLVETKPITMQNEILNAA